jgi:hypothetical protein
LSAPARLEAFEAALREYSHDDRAVGIVREFAEELGKTKQRQAVFNQSGALVRLPIAYEAVREQGIVCAEEDPFTFLQGDIIATDAAYFLGERLVNARFVIASSTCDLVPGRREYAALLRLTPVMADNPRAKEVIGELLSFRSIRRMYLPPLADDSKQVVCHAVEFDGIAQIRTTDLQLATRYASLSLVGWRVFGTLVRNLMARTGEAEVKLRTQA